MKNVIHSIVVKDGKYIVMPNYVYGEDGAKWGNLAHPNPLANSGVGDPQQQYPHGTKFVNGDRRFRYVYIHTVDAQDKTGLGLFNISESATGSTANITWGSVGSAVGDTVVGLVTTGFDDTDPDEDAFAGGWLVPPYPQPYGSFEVLHSTNNAGARVSGEIDLTLDYAISNTVAAGTNYGELNFSEYIKVARGWAGEYGGWATVVGVTLVISEASTWQWLQTYGPCYMSMDGAVGASIDENLVHFGRGGAVYLAHSAGYENRQQAGYMIPGRLSSQTATSLVFLTLKY